MRWSFSTSLVLHGAILVAALVVLPNPNKYDIKPQQAIQVDISQIGDHSKRKAMTKTPETPKEKPAQKKTETVKKAEPAPKVAEIEKKAVVEAAAEPPPPEPKKEEPKKEEPKKDEAKPLEPDPLKDLIKDTVTETPEKKEEAKKKEEPKKTAEKPKDKKKKPKLDIDQLEAFLNKVDELQAPEQPAEADTQVAAGEANLQGSDAELSATIIEAFSQKLRGCWRAPPGARESDFSIQIRFRLTMDGMLEGQPEVLNHSSEQLFEATARSALSALVDCQAYDFLPKDRYDLWQDNTLNFNPNMMASG